jgi:hypothetical protein
MPREARHLARLSRSSRLFPEPILKYTKQVSSLLDGTQQRREGDKTMMFLALLVPFGLLAVLLGMDRLERWTVNDRDDS